MSERLDRVLCSLFWKDRFPSTMVLHEGFLGSDHCPLVVYAHWIEKREPRYFLFENC